MINRRKRLERKIEALQPYLNLLSDFRSNDEQEILSPGDLQVLRDYNDYQDLYRKRYGKLYVPQEIKEESKSYDRRKTIIREDEVYSR